MMNPVLRREAITTLRGWKNYGVMVFYLLVMAAGAVIFYSANGMNSYNYGFDPKIIVYLYIILAAIQMALVVLTVPALTAGSISGERERQTLDLLLVTKLSSLSIVIGKLLSSMAFVLLLIVSTLPIFAVVFYFGSIGITALLMTFLFALTTAFMLGGISVFFSCIYKKTVVSIMLVYIITGVLCLGTLIAALMPYMVGNYENVSVWGTIIKIIPNPGVGFFSLMDSQVGTGTVLDVLFNYGDIKMNSIQEWIIGNLWLAHMIFQVVVGTIFVLLAAWMINPAREKKYKKPREKKADKAKA